MILPVTAETVLKNYSRIDDFPVHTDYGDIRGFLATCEVRDQVNGVTHFGLTNCNYILFPSGLLIANYGYHGAVLMQRILELGVESVEKQLRQNIEEIRGLLQRSK